MQNERKKKEKWYKRTKTIMNPRIPFNLPVIFKEPPQAVDATTTRFLMQNEEESRFKVTRYLTTILRKKAATA